MESTPSAEATACSIGVVIKHWISAADAPGYAVVTLTTVFDSFGYCRIGRFVAARKPISRISRLTTTDRTGRLMKISVKTIAGACLFGARSFRKTGARQLDHAFSNAAPARESAVPDRSRS